MVRTFKIVKAVMWFGLMWCTYKLVSFNFIANSSSGKETSQHLGELTSLWPRNMNFDRSNKVSKLENVKEGDNMSERVIANSEGEHKLKGQETQQRDSNIFLQPSRTIPVEQKKEVIPEPESKLKVVYTSLAHCQKPEYLPDYKALCVGDKKSSAVSCLPNHYLLGIRKCGTTDVIKWFQYHCKDVKLLVKGDQISSECPMDYFKHKFQKKISKDTDVMNYSPGEIMFSSVKKRNETHLVIGTTIQYIAFISEPSKMKYLLTLRNPTEMLISYLFHAHNHKWIERSISFKDFNGEYLHNLVNTLLTKLKVCLESYGELACVYMYSSADGNLQSVLQHGLYVVYVQELYKFVPKESVYINQLEEYSSNQLEQATKMMNFFGHKLNVSAEEILLTSKKQMNTGNKALVLPETIKSLNDLYRPYNIRLAKLLGDDKWLYN